MDHHLDRLIAANTAFMSMADLLAAGGAYRPSCCVSENAMLRIAEAYDAEQAKRGDPRRAYRYGHELRGRTTGKVWVNQALRDAEVLAYTDHAALLVYTMPNGRSYYWEVPIEMTWANLRGEHAGAMDRALWQAIRNVNQTKPPKRWAAAIAADNH